MKHQFHVLAPHSQGTPSALYNELSWIGFASFWDVSRKTRIVFSKNTLTPKTGVKYSGTIHTQKKKKKNLLN
jgi:hypothetical protein